MRDLRRPTNRRRDMFKLAAILRAAFQDHPPHSCLGVIPNLDREVKSMVTTIPNIAAVSTWLSAVSEVQTDNGERRKSVRIPRTMSLLVQTLTDDEKDMVGDPFFAISRDVSGGGMGFISPVQIEASVVEVSFHQLTCRRIVSRVCHSSFCQDDGQQHLYLTGVEFLYERYLYGDDMPQTA